MGASAAATAQGMATRHRKSVAVIQAGVGEVNALLAKMIKSGKTKWGGYGTYCEWYVRKLKKTSSWETGQLGTRSFEEKDPMDKAELPYCFISETYGVSEKSIKTNRAAGAEKLYDIQKENARNAQNALYRALVAALYSRGNDALEPVGLRGICGDTYESSGNVTSAGTESYAGIQLNASALSAWNASYSTMGWTYEYWYPTVNVVETIPCLVGTDNKWSSEGIYYLGWMEQAMHRTADVSGTGEIIKPDLALMSTDPWYGLMSILAKSQLTYNVPLGNKDAVLSQFTNVRVGGLDCVYDEKVPLDHSSSKEMVFVLDSDAFYIDSLNTKSEGLIEGEWKANDPAIVGGVGVYKCNMALVCKTPKAVGVIVGCDD